MEIKINLASKPYLNKQSARLWLGLVCVLMMLVLVINASYIIQLKKHESILDERLKELDAQVSTALKITGDYTPEKFASVKSQIEFANEVIIADQFHWTDLLTKFEETIPEKVSINSIQPSFKDRSVKLSGVARDVTTLTQFVDNLLKTPDLNQTFLKNHGEVEVDEIGRKQRYTGFSLEIREAF